MVENYPILKQKADALFWYFETYLFKNTGNYPRKTNLVLEFAEFISQASFEELNSYVPFSSVSEFSDLKKLINNGIDAWLDDSSLKTLFMT